MQEQSPAQAAALRLRKEIEALQAYVGLKSAEGAVEREIAQHNAQVEQTKKLKKQAKLEKRWRAK